MRRVFPLLSIVVLAAACAPAGEDPTDPSGDPARAEAVDEAREDGAPEAAPAASGPLSVEWSVGGTADGPVGGTAARGSPGALRAVPGDAGLPDGLRVENLVIDDRPMMAAPRVADDGTLIGPRYSVTCLVVTWDPVQAGD